MYLSLTTDSTQDSPSKKYAKAPRKFTFRFVTPIAAGIQIQTVTATNGDEAEFRLREVYAGARCITLIKSEPKAWIDLETGKTVYAKTQDD